MRKLIFDIETNGLLEDVTKIHCIVAMDIESEALFIYNPSNIQEGLQLLEEADMLIGHNILKYDLPVLKKLHNFTWDKEWMDTLLVSRLIYPNLADNDFTFRRNNPELLPGKLIGSHSLKAWGYRLKEYKGTYAEDTADCWAEYSKEMEEYCVQDVKLNKKLFDSLMRKNPSSESLELEHRFAKVIWRQEQYGFMFDMNSAMELYGELCQLKVEVGDELKKIFKPWIEKDRTFTPKANNKRWGYQKGCPVTKIKFVEFNPSSRKHIADRLKKVRGWKPTVKTEIGTPIVDESVLKKLPYPEIPHLLKYLLLSKRIGQLAEGKQAWIKAEKDGRIYGSVNTNGAVTGRCTHSNPNVAQVPSVGSEYGKECRSLFVVPEGKKLVGCDASGLELRCLAHYMAKYDKGKYADVILNGDIHTENQQAAGLPTRDMAKTFIYGFLYGAGNAKIGSIVGKGAKAGGALKSKFLKKLPALDMLVNQVKEAANRGWLKGMDGRKLPIRSAHAALNTLLQSAGALVMKIALIILDEDLQHDYIPGSDYEFVANIHDEFQIEVNADIAEDVGKRAVTAIQNAGKHFKFRCPLDGEFKIGDNWAETH